MGASWGIGLETDGITITAPDGAGVVSVPPMVAFGPGGMPAVGREAYRLAAAGYPTFSDVVSRTGDPVPVVGSDGSARPGAELTAWAALALLRSVSPGGHADHVVLATPVTWRPFDVAELHAALARTGSDVGRFTLVSRPVAAVAELVAEGRLRPGARVAVADIGRSATSLALVAGGEHVLATGRIDDFGTAVLDQALLRDVLGHCDPQLGERLQHDRTARHDLANLATACRAARRELETRPVTTVQVRCGERHDLVRVVRADVEMALREPVRRAVTAVVANLGVRENTTDWDGVVLLGDAASTPLVAECVSVELGTVAIVGSAPARTVTRGAARIAEARPVEREAVTVLAAVGAGQAQGRARRDAALWADVPSEPFPRVTTPPPPRITVPPASIPARAGRGWAAVLGVVAAVAVAVGGIAAVDAVTGHDHGAGFTMSARH